MIMIISNLKESIQAKKKKVFFAQILSFYLEKYWTRKYMLKLIIECPTITAQFGRYELIHIVRRLMIITSNRNANYFGIILQ